MKSPFDSVAVAGDTVVALFTRAWIEIFKRSMSSEPKLVALFTRAWIEIKFYYAQYSIDTGRPLYEGVD